MAKIKIKKADVWIDMTPMSDVMVLLLTFFMLTSTFVKQEPVKVNTPGSVSEIKVPENNVLNVLVGNDGKIFMSMDKTTDTQATLASVANQFGLSLTTAQEKAFLDDPMWGVPMNKLQAYLSLNKNIRPAELKNYGIPTDSVAGKTGNAAMSEFQVWVKAAHEANPDAKIAIKADEKTPYKTIKKIMSELQDMNENRYYLITQYKKAED
ncbi:biopolymer transporter ExbD [Hallella multisaccharivorax DSM 17128]|uniref:Outer membrane transport energization protein ExbD (TC 2.C.1.1.1) n=1 Tax=Hallella multisaccharivorax DSM 17128 TaxID=688246 RepID=F8N9H6_9BACT|nr:biopolymer transporter ExbD [Hallella multisaccharivorax]EGN55690.1 outer membrane transport energization protein ExbD (TC 2.C.1.1.1) [Hallella multisaccharivorax DSM 17128]GJG29195.1 biopolymer transporter ExbD [Hallella multisaccharivorax DSM 17128]